MFYGQFYTRVKKISKDKEENSSSFEPFNTISLEIVDNDGTVNLEQCLDNFTKEETIETDENTFIKEVKFLVIAGCLNYILQEIWKQSRERKNDLVDFQLKTRYE